MATEESEVTTTVTSSKGTVKVQKVRLASVVTGEATKSILRRSSSLGKSFGRYAFNHLYRVRKSLRISSIPGYRTFSA